MAVAIFASLIAFGYYYQRRFRVAAAAAENNWVIKSDELRALVKSFIFPAHTSMTFVTMVVGLAGLQYSGASAPIKLKKFHSFYPLPK